jgi:hypothetical protein
MLLTWGGDFVSEPLEIWSNSIRLTEDTDLDGASFEPPGGGGSQSLVDAYGAKVRTHFTATNSGYSTNVRLKWVKFNQIGADGRQVNQQQTWLHQPTPLTGVPGTGTPSGAITHAMCVTFLTEATRGRASRGRVFVPHPNMIVQSGEGFRYSAATCQLVANQWLAFLSDLADAPGIDGPNSLRASVVSDLDAVGPYRNILRAQVGNFPDYMGSRRNRTRETRFTSTAVVNA